MKRLLFLCFYLTQLAYSHAQQSGWTSITNLPDLFLDGKIAQEKLAFQSYDIPNAALGNTAKVLFKSPEENPVRFSDVLFLTPQEGYILGSGLSIFHCTDAGKSWNQLQFRNQGEAFLSLVESKEHVLVAGESPYIFRTKKQRHSWEAYDLRQLLHQDEQHLKTPAIRIDKIRNYQDKLLVAVGAINEDALFIFSTNQGDSWQRLAMPPLLHQGLALRDIALLSEQRWVLLSQGIGRILITDDAGKHWQEKTLKIQTDSDMSFHCLALADAEEVYMAGTAALYKSQDAGNTWQRIDLVNLQATTGDMEDCLFTAMQWQDGRLYLSSQNDYSEDRKTFAYVYTPASGQFSALLSHQQDRFAGQSLGISAIDSQHIYLLDCYTLYQVGLQK